MDGAHAAIAQALGEISRRTGRPVAGAYKQRVADALDDLGAASLPVIEAVRDADQGLGLELLVTLVEQQAAAIRLAPVARAPRRPCPECGGDPNIEGEDELGKTVVYRCRHCNGTGLISDIPACETDPGSDAGEVG